MVEGTKSNMFLLLLSCLCAHLATAMVVPTKGRIQTISSSTPTAQTPTNVIRPANSFMIGKTSPVSTASDTLSTFIGSKLPAKEKERFGDFVSKITPSTEAMDITALAKGFKPASLLNKFVQTPSEEEEKKPATRRTVKIQAVKTVPKKLQLVKEAPITPVSEDVKNVLAKVEETKNAVTKKIGIPNFDLTEWILKNTPTDTNKDFDLDALVKSITPTTSLPPSKVDGKKTAVKQVLKQVPMKVSVPKKQPVKTIAFKQPVKATALPTKQQAQTAVVTAKQPPAAEKVTSTPEVKPVVIAAAPKVNALFFKPTVKAAVKEEVKPVVKLVPQKQETETKQLFTKPSIAKAVVPPVVKVAAPPVVKVATPPVVKATVPSVVKAVVPPVVKAAVLPIVKETIKPVEKPVVKAAVIKPADVKPPVTVKSVESKPVEPKKEEVKIYQPPVMSTRSSKGSKPIGIPEKKSEYQWAPGRYAFSLLPLAPGDRRKTLLTEVVKGTIWTLDQIQGIINVNVPVRAVVVKLSGGGLLIYNPVGPTEENLAMVRNLEARHGPVKHIVLASLGLEHKAFTGPFSQEFPDATVWIQPGQWSFPFNLPPKLQLGFFKETGKVKEIPLKASDAPWFKDFDHCVLEKLSFKSVGGFGETAFFHRSTGTLLVTDTIIKVGSEPSPVLQEDPRAILYHSRDTIQEEVFDTPDTRRRGYRRMALFSLFFYPSGIDVTPFAQAVGELFKVSEQVHRSTSNQPQRILILPNFTNDIYSSSWAVSLYYSPWLLSPCLHQSNPNLPLLPVLIQTKILGEGSLPFAGLYPWSWKTSEEKNFKALQGGLLVAPILRKLILDREPVKVLAWADQVSQWPMKRIIPSHFENNIKVSSGKEFRAAFKFLERPRAVPLVGYNPNAGPAQPDVKDLFLLDFVSDLFTKLGIVAPSQVAKQIK